MKPFLVLLFFGFLIVIFIGGVLTQNDLTPNTPPAANTTNSPGALLMPAAQGNGATVCASAYTIRSGDTLSKLAKACSLTLSELLAANPQITDANLIYEGQVITIPQAAMPAATSAPTATAVQAVVANPPPVASGPTPTVDEIFSAFETARAPKEGALPATSVVTPRPTEGTMVLEPGKTVQVHVAGFPPNVEVEFGIGQVGKDPFMIDKSFTDAQGVANVTVSIPANARNGEKWTVTITTTGSAPQVSATAEPFIIGQ